MTQAATLAEARRLLPSDPRRAARLVEAIGPARDSAATLLLATGRRRSGDVAGALAAIDHLAARQPRAWGVHYEHAMALSAAGRSPAAIVALRRARGLKPDAMLATHALWDLAMVCGEPEAELPRPPIAALSSPEVAAAVARFLRGEAGTRAVLAERFGLDPNDAAAACLIAEVASGHEDAVVTLLEAALSLAPGHHPAAFRLAQALHRRHDDAAALATLEPLLGWASPAVMALHASVAVALGRTEVAAESLSRAVGAAPADVGLRLAHGHALRAIGERDAAVAEYRRALASEPACGEAYWSLADLKSGALTEADGAAMRALLVGPELPAAIRSHILFALGRALEEAGRDEAAWARYLEANRLRRAAEPFDIAAHEAFVDRTIALCDARFFAARVGSGDPSDAPIFVVGMPRAGSTLVEQILASHSAIESASELPDLTAAARTLAAGHRYPEVLADVPAGRFTQVGGDYLARAATRRRTARTHFVDKFPGNVLHLPLLHLALPNARVIDVRRDALDCCVSLFAQSFARGQAYSYDLGDLGRVYAAYVRLTAHLDAVLPGQVLRVCYEALVDDLEGQTRRMLDHVGLAFEPACLRFHERGGAVRTASSEQVRRPLYRGSVGRGRRFGSALAPLVAALAAGGVAAADARQ